MHVFYALFAATRDILYLVLDFYIWLLIVGAAISWLTAFNIINTHNRFVQIVGDFVYRLTEPLLRPLRTIIPVIGGMDISPMVLIFIIWFLQSFIRHLG